MFSESSRPGPRQLILPPVFIFLLKGFSLCQRLDGSSLLLPGNLLTVQSADLFLDLGLLSLLELILLILQFLLHFLSSYLFLGLLEEVFGHAVELALESVL